MGGRAGSSSAGWRKDWGEERVGIFCGCDLVASRRLARSNYEGRRTEPIDRAHTKKIGA